MEADKPNLPVNGISVVAGAAEGPIHALVRELSGIRNLQSEEVFWSIYPVEAYGTLVPESSQSCPWYLPDRAADRTGRIPRAM